MDAKFSLQRKRQKLERAIEVLFKADDQIVLHIIGGPGTGKTTAADQVIRKIANTRGPEGKQMDVRVMPSYLPPMSLYMEVVNAKDADGIIFDDTAFGTDKKLMAIVKGATSINPMTGKRTISWKSKGLPKDFADEADITAKILLISNDDLFSEKKADVAAAESRIIKYPYDLSFYEIKEGLLELAEKKRKEFKLTKEQSNEFLDVLFQIATPATKSFDLRVYDKYAVWVREIKEWKEYLRDQFHVDERYYLMEEVLALGRLSNVSTKVQEIVFEECGQLAGVRGCSRTNFYDKKKLWFPKEPVLHRHIIGRLGVDVKASIVKTAKKFGEETSKTFDSQILALSAQPSAETALPIAHEKKSARKARSSMPAKKPTKLKQTEKQAR